jgi:hypothetical protein
MITRTTLDEHRRFHAVIGILGSAQIVSPLPARSR